MKAYMPHHCPLLIYFLFFINFVGAGGELQEAAQGGEERRGLSPGAPQVHDYGASIQRSLLETPLLFVLVLGYKDP
jgi:hypothetical protein